MEKLVFIGIMILICVSCSQPFYEPSLVFIEPNPETYVNLMPVIREYFFYRKQAVLKGEMDIFYERYPTLDEGINIERGINVEASQVRHLQSLSPFDGNIVPEYYEKIRVMEIQGEVQILVHGIALYLWKDSEGIYEESGGEFMMVIYAHEQGGGWGIYRTDEVTLMEWKDIN